MPRRNETKVAVAVLPQPYQLVLVLHEGLNLTFEQIGAIMMVPATAARELYRTAKHLLRRNSDLTKQA